jgi:hypothetical protein
MRRACGAKPPVKAIPARVPVNDSGAVLAGGAGAVGERRRAARRVKAMPGGRWPRWAGAAAGAMPRGYWKAMQGGRRSRLPAQQPRRPGGQGDRRLRSRRGAGLSSVPGGCRPGREPGRRRRRSRFPRGRPPLGRPAGSRHFPAPAEGGRHSGSRRAGRHSGLAQSTLARAGAGARAQRPRFCCRRDSGR